MKMKEHKFYGISSVVALVGLIGIIFATNYTVMAISVVLFGLGYANLFSIIFSLALKHKPDFTNEVSAILVTGIAGGAVVSPILGIVTDAFGGRQTAAFVALLIIWLYTLCILKPVREISEK